MIRDGILAHINLNALEKLATGLKRPSWLRYVLDDEATQESLLHYGIHDWELKSSKSNHPVPLGNPIKSFQQKKKSTFLTFVSLYSGLLAVFETFL